ncbi:Secreted RxLR effector peptide protein [Phytophthora palmivora]|uniref:Secreted RxLR effector peptide protein n=1 Tax=Phytophthora palmivora TaxID=4796 RepID=A0A2P4X2K3_9STRA|nr:Secreted RxLR effector peptide protein [Phytophthora palmivora]
MRLYSVALVATVLLANVEQVTTFELTTADYPTVVISSLANQQSGGAPKRLLRRYHDEERAPGGGTTSELAAAFRGSTSTLGYTLVRVNTNDKYLLDKFKFAGIISTFTSANLQKWTDAVQKFNSKNLLTKVSVIGRLTEQHGDANLAHALVAAEKGADSSKAALIRTLRKDQLTRWHNKGNSVGDVIKLLRIPNEDFHMAYSLKLEVLDDYIKLVKGKKYDQTSLVKALNKAFGGEDKVLALLLTAKNREFTANLLENSLLSKWLSENKSPTTVLQLLKLDRDVDVAFIADNLNKIAKYVDDFNLKNPNAENKKSLLHLYLKSFGNSAVANKLASAMNDPDTRNLAEKLQTQLLQVWRSNRVTVDNAVRILDIPTSQGATIISRKLDVLVEFIKLNDGEQYLIRTLTEKFGSRGTLATILERASTTTEATALQKKQFMTWIDEGVEPDNLMSYIWRKIKPTTTEQESIRDKFKTFYLSEKKNEGAL